jgi:adenylate kinase family enzyme
MSLGPTHHGYLYQDLITGIALVDLLLGTAENITVDTKGFDGDRFDDLNIAYTGAKRVRVQIKHTTADRALSKDTFSADGRNLKLNKLLDSLLHDLATSPGTTYRIVVRDKKPDDDLGVVLKPVDPTSRPGDPLPGVTTSKYRFEPDALRVNKPWVNLVKHLSDDQLRAACASLIVDTDAPASTISFADPGPAERALLRRVTEELGAGRTPNTDVSPAFAAHALVLAATAARVVDTGTALRELIEPRLGLRVDFGAVAEGHPIEAAVAVPREGAAAEVGSHIDATAPAGGRVVVEGEPGVGKSWLSEQLAETYRANDWVVARHHCWLGATDTNRTDRVLTEVVIGSLLDQLEHAVPESTADLRPRFAASAEALEAALQNCRDTHPDKNVLLIVDGLDHVDRVLGRSTSQEIDPSRRLVEQLAAVTLPAGVCLLIASQPGTHLEPATPVTGPVQMPRMSWDEVKALSAKHGLLESPDGIGPVEEADERAIVDLVFERSSGNALYATYLCRLALGASPLDEQAPPVTVNDLIHRLSQIPDSATNVEEYYDYLRDAMTPDQRFTTDTLALCYFALTADELAEVLPDPIRSYLMPALRTLAPVLNTQPGLGGLRLHHESFARHIRTEVDDATVTSIRRGIASWLDARGFLTDSRAIRHLPDLLANLGEYDQLKALVQPGFVADGIKALHPPEALQRAIGVVAREAEARLDWPTLIVCIETRKALDTYENDALADTVIEYAEIIVHIIGADVVAERLLYEGRPTFPPRWGLRISEAVDKAGAAAPWKAYIEAWENETKRETSTYSSDRDGTLQLAAQRGALRMRAQRGDVDPSIVGRIAEFLGDDHQASLADLVEVFAAGLPADYLPDIAVAIADPSKAAQALLTLADLSAIGIIGLPEPTELALQAWTLDPTLDIVGYLHHGIAPADVLAGLGTTDLEADLIAATDTILKDTRADHATVNHWLSLITLGQAIDATIPLKLTSKLSGVGFYRAWLRYTIATIGIAEDVRTNVITPEAASSAVVVALADLIAAAKPFTGSPRACDLYFIHPLIHEVIESSLVVVQQDDLDQVLDHLIAIGDGTTTTTNFGLPENGPLATTDLLAILARVSDHIGIDAIHDLITVIRARRNDDHSDYSRVAAFELEIARICHAAGAHDEATECWHRAADLLASYGGHKDPTLSEIVDSIRDITDIDTARDRLRKLLDLVYLVRQHTDGRDTSHYVTQWWELAATIDPIAAARDGADLLLSVVGFEDARAHAAHTHLLQEQTSTADPIVLAALRLTVGTTWRKPAVDLELLTRLHAELGTSPQADTMLAVVANTIAATYDNQPMQYTNDQPKSIVDTALVDAVVRLGGPEFGIRTPRPDEEGNRRFPPDSRTDSNEILKRLIATQRPEVPDGRAGAIVIARDIDNQRYQDDPTPKWDLDAAANMIGYRILQATLTQGTDAGIALIDDIARETRRYSDNAIFAVLGDGLAAHAGDNQAVNTVASYCLAVAYQRIRGGGGWRQFAGRERRELWVKAHKLDPETAERTLAAAVTSRVDADSYGSFGATQGLIAAFAARPTSGPGGTAIDCWDAAFPIIEHRLPGSAKRGTHTYRPTPTPDSPDDLKVAMATLAIATIAQATREEIRQALVAATLLITNRPKVGQTALATVLRGNLDAGRVTWLLDIIRTNLPVAEMTDDLGTELTRLAVGDWLSVRALAGRILDAHGRPVPYPPATEPAPKVRAAFHDLLALAGEEDE